MSDSTHQHQQHASSSKTNQSSPSNKSSRGASQTNDRFRRVEDILDRRNQQQMQQQVQRQAKNQMQNNPNLNQQMHPLQPPHQCNHEAEIAIMGNTLRQHHDTLAIHGDKIDLLEAASVASGSAITGINNTLSELTATVKGLVKTIDEWTGSLRILIWLTGILAAIFTGSALALVGYLVSKIG